MTPSQLETTVRRWVDAGWNHGQLDLVDRMYAPDYTLHDPNAPIAVSGRAAFKQYVTIFRSAFPDISFSVDDVVAAGDRVAWRFTATGSQLGELAGVPASGRHIEVSGLVISRFQGDLWTEDWIAVDVLGLMRQIGAIPAGV